MNKKVLTLCAGVLLVSGSAVFTMNALNVGNEKAQSTYVAAISTRAADGVITGYDLVYTATKGEAQASWKVVVNEGSYKLMVDENFGLTADAQIVKGESISSFKINALGIIEGLTIDESEVALFDGEGNVVTNPTAEDSYFLAKATTSKVDALKA